MSHNPSYHQSMMSPPQAFRVRCDVLWDGDEESVVIHCEARTYPAEQLLSMTSSKRKLSITGQENSKVAHAAQLSIRDALENILGPF